MWVWWAADLHHSLWTHQLDSVIHWVCSILWRSDLKHLSIRSLQQLSSGDAVSAHRGRGGQCIGLSRVRGACCLLDCFIEGLTAHILFKHRYEVTDNRGGGTEWGYRTHCLTSQVLLKPGNDLFFLHLWSCVVLQFTAFKMQTFNLTLCQLHILCCHE